MKALFFCVIFVFWCPLSVCWDLDHLRSRVGSPSFCRAFQPRGTSGKVAQSQPRRHSWTSLMTNFATPQRCFKLQFFLFVMSFVISKTCMFLVQTDTIISSFSITRHSFLEDLKLCNSKSGWSFFCVFSVVKPMMWNHRQKCGDISKKLGTNFLIENSLITRISTHVQVHWLGIFVETLGPPGANNTNAKSVNRDLCPRWRVMEPC